VAGIVAGYALYRSQWWHDATAAPMADVRGASPPPASVVVAPPPAAAPPNASGAVRGVTDREIVLGMATAMSGPAREYGRQMKLGIEAAFQRVNDHGGVHGRQLRLVTVDDGYEPARTTSAMKQLYEHHGVFGIIGNFGTPTATVAVPFALDHKMLFFGAYSGASLLPVASRSTRSLRLQLPGELCRGSVRDHELLDPRAPHPARAHRCACTE
jgi:ABC-type branched-subunit amino acid transport system substrate-binding protein